LTLNQHFFFDTLTNQKNITMSVTQGTKRILSESKVIPDVLPDDVNLSYDLSISWPDTTFNTSGQELSREATQPEPKLSISPAVNRLALSTSISN
jgi:hypothetical protein